MKLIIVEGVTCSGKTAIIKRAMLALEKSGLKVKHVTWPQPEHRCTVKQFVDKAVTAACTFDGRLSTLEKMFDVVICDSHPVITQQVQHPALINAARLWQTITKPDAVLLLNCQPQVIRSRAAACDKTITLNDIVAQTDAYAELSGAQLGTMRIHRANVSDSLGLLLASGDLVRIAESLVNQP